jgi:precorrin-2/cobalt-factor-2 C20-methyltransferase
MSLGCFYGIGLGPGDPGLLSLRSKEILSHCPWVFVPKARIKAQSVALEIAADFIPSLARVEELVFPMVEDQSVIQSHWLAAAERITTVLKEGNDACFLTLGDALLYSTYVYLLRAIKTLLPDLVVRTVPGITAFSAVAALTHFPTGEAKHPVTIIPCSDDLSLLEKALDMGGTLVLMKVGKRLELILDLLDKHSLLDRGVFVARAGMAGEYVETDLKRLRGADPKRGYLATMLVNLEGDPLP